MLQSTLVLILVIILQSAQSYLLGVGRADVTGPSADVPFMGYAKMEQKGAGIHLRLFSRAFIIDDGEKRIVFVSVDAGMIGNNIRHEVLDLLHSKYNLSQVYTQDNVLLSGTHTHSAPGGFLMDFMFDLNSLGFVPDTFNAMVRGITLSILRAHDNLQEGRLFVSKGELLNANINRSPTAYLQNPEEERMRYEHDTDKSMVQLQFISSSNKPLGVINWFAVHPTSMNNTNHLVSSDNVGYAAILLEQKINPDSLIGKGKFVAAFASSNLGDVSPNIKGAKCVKTGTECHEVTSSCHVAGDVCIASGPGVDMFDSTRIIAERMYTKALELFDSRQEEVVGQIDYVHRYIRPFDETAEYRNTSTGETKQVKGCVPALGHSFAAGTTDGPGAFDFKQGTTNPMNPLWNLVTNLLATPSPDQVACHKPKPILLDTGEMNVPYQWSPRTVSTQLFRLGHLALVGVPGELTTMAGRRLRRALQDEMGLLVESDVIIAGLANTYADYVTTPEEYQVQRYEGASTIYGPHTLTIYISQFVKMAQHLAGSRSLPAVSVVPENIKDQVISFLPEPLFDKAPSGKQFGQCIQQPPTRVNVNEDVRVKFISGHPRNNLLTEKSYLTIERLTESEGGNSTWRVVATDANWDTKFLWRRTSVLPIYSEAEVRWQTSDTYPEGTYRIRHFGVSKEWSFGGTKKIKYSGKTKTFQLTKDTKK
uniref:Neutral ceramidase n=2 Tax=Cacopsylla melanoneura TaxID=428564 RepID=A0A8D8YI34_9HEMI